MVKIFDKKKKQFQLIVLISIQAMDSFGDL